MSRVCLLGFNGAEQTWIHSFTIVIAGNVFVTFCVTMAIELV